MRDFQPQICIFEKKLSNKKNILHDKIQEKENCPLHLQLCHRFHQFCNILTERKNGQKWANPMNCFKTLWPMEKSNLH